MSKKVEKLSYTAVVRSPYDQDAIIRDNFPGFKEDYLVIHSLIRRYQPYRFMEIGTSSGAGTNVICNAMGIRKWLPNSKKVMSIDVPPGTDPKLMYPDETPEDGHPEKAGADCSFPYQQIFGNSLGFDFSPYYPIDAWFIDGKHNYKYAKNDTELALKSEPVLIMWHDMQMDEVNDAVHDVMQKHPKYDLRRVDGTRMGVATRRLI
jgi:hypothetical protein